MYGIDVEMGMVDAGMVVVGAYVDPAWSLR